MKKTIALWLLFLLLPLCFCAGKNNPDDNTDVILFEKAMEEFNDENYEEAVLLFERVQNEHPTSNLVPDAELKIGECHFERRKYLEAVETFKNFVKLHPTHERLAYAYYRIGESYAELAPDEIDRDLSHAVNSVAYLLKIQECCTGSEYIEQARPIIEENQRKLAQRIIYIGDFYFKREHYRAALQRYKEAQVNYPQLGFDEDLLYKIGICFDRLDERDQLVSLVDEFSKRFPKSSSLDKLRNRLAGN